MSAKNDAAMSNLLLLAAFIFPVDAGAGIVLVPDGTYVLGTLSTRPGSSNSYIVPRDNVTIRMSKNTVLKVKAGRNDSVPWNIIYSSRLVTNFRVIGGTIDGGRNALGPGDGERSNTFVGSTGGGYRVHIYGVTFRNMPGNNPVAFSGTAGRRGEIVVEKCRFIDGGSGMPGNASTDHSSIYLLGSNNKVVDNWFKSRAQVAGAACDEWNVHDNRFFGNGKAVHLVSRIGAKIFRFYNNYAERFGGYGYLQSTSATFDNTYANHLEDIHGNTFRNFRAAQPIVSFGGRVKRLDIQDNKILSDGRIAATAVYLRTKAGGGKFEGNFIDNTYDADIDFGSGMAKVHLVHELHNGFDRTANYAAIGSRAEDSRYNRTFTKRTAADRYRTTTAR